VAARKFITAWSQLSMENSSQICSCQHLTPSHPAAFPTAHQSACCLAFHQLQWWKGCFCIKWVLPTHKQYISSSSATTLVPVSNNHSLRQKYQCILDGSRSSDGISYCLMENYTLPVTQATGPIAYLPPLLGVRNVVVYMHHQNDKCVTLSPQAAVLLSPLTQCLAMMMPLSGRVLHVSSPLLLYLGWCTLRIYVSH
jgi:hypothetical protein